MNKAILPRCPITALLLADKDAIAVYPKKNNTDVALISI